MLQSLNIFPGAFLHLFTIFAIPFLHLFYTFSRAFLYLFRRFPPIKQALRKQIAIPFLALFSIFCPSFQGSVKKFSVPVSFSWNMPVTAELVVYGFS